MAVMGAHLLLALSRNAPRQVRWMGLVLWLICSAFVIYGHAGYFLRMQDQAGERNASKLDSTMEAFAATPKRDLSSVLDELAKVKGVMLGLSRVACADDCARIRARTEVLRTRSEALEAEADEVRSWQLQRRELEGRRAVLHEDPVTRLLAEFFNVPGNTVKLGIALLFAVMLESVGCFAWYLVFLPGDYAVTDRGVAEVTVTPEAETPHAPAVTELDMLVTQVLPQIQAKRIGCTVKAIREYLGCSQAKASAVRRCISEGS